jgi:hypothetical protein
VTVVRSLEAGIELKYGSQDNIPCYTNETLPKGNDVSVPSIGGKYYGLSSRTRLIYLSSIVEDQVRVSSFSLVCPQDD